MGGSIKSKTESNRCEPQIRGSGEHLHIHGVVSDQGVE